MGGGLPNAADADVDGLQLLHNCLSANDAKLRVKAAFCLRWFCFSRPACVAGVVSCGTVELLCDYACGPADARTGGSAGLEIADLDLREKALEALLQMGEGSTAAVEAMTACEMPARTTSRMTKLLHYARENPGEEAHAVQEEVKLLVRLKRRMEQGASEAARATDDDGAAPLMLADGSGPQFTLQ